MGYLDEAIRDHIELQRRRGVAEDELRRVEDEALGPIGAEGLPDPVSERATEQAEVEADFEDEPEADDPAAAAAAEVEEPEFAEPVAVETSREELDQPTQAMDLSELDDALAAEDEASEQAAPAPELDPDDPLAATPDFLQETPEHDRLWFEQKPPKDFDF